MSHLNFAAADEATAHFANMDEVRKVLKIALIAAEHSPLRKNVILYGPGGHGKSDFTYLYLQAATGKDPAVIAFHSESSAAENAGGVDIPSLQGGTLRYNVDKSWMASEYAIWEEAFDAPPGVLLANKDILTRRQYTVGATSNVATKLVIICTNHDPAGFGTDMSKAALIERFPFKLKVSFDGLTTNERVSAYRKIIRHYDDSLPNKLSSLVSQTLSEIATGEIWSPRRLIYVVESLKAYAEVISGENTPVSREHFLDVAKLLDFDTAANLEELYRQDRMKQIHAFETATDSLLSSIDRDIIPVQRFVPKINNAEQVGKWLVVLADILVKVKKVIENANELRDMFGTESHAITDKLVARARHTEAEIWETSMMVVARNAELVEAGIISNDKKVG